MMKKVHFFMVKKLKSYTTFILNIWKFDRAACSSSNLELVEMLIGKGARINAYGWTPIFIPPGRK